MRTRSFWQDWIDASRTPYPHEQDLHHFRNVRNAGIWIVRFFAQCAGRGVTQEREWEQRDVHGREKASDHTPTWVTLTAKLWHPGDVCPSGNESSMLLADLKPRPWEVVDWYSVESALATRHCRLWAITL